MAITFAEHAESRQMALTVGGEGQRLRFTAYRDDDQAAVRAAFLAFIPETWDDLTFVGADLRPYANSGLWDCTADYAYSAERAAGIRTLTEPGIDDPLGPEFEFDLSAEQAHITQSIRTVTSRFDRGDGGVTGGGDSLAAWAAETAYLVGDAVSKSGNIYVCVVAGTSASSGGPSGTGTGIVDGSVGWNYSAPVGGTVYTWQQSTAYTVDEQVDSHGFKYVCRTSGTSAPTGDGPTGEGTGIADGSVSWDFAGSDTDPSAPDYGQAIGVSRDRVNGCNILVGHLEFGITAQYYPVTLAVLETLLDLVGTFNQATWYNFPPKTLLYLGCTGAPRPGDIWTLKHRFAASKNLRDVKIGSRITLPFKGGWDFLWCAYRDDVISTKGGNRFNIQRPYAAYVEQVYRPGNFSALPI
ncbi:hypothetical protein J0H58_21735 [bacterium]|nr:hypothetical protein [bacterium]